MPTTPKAKCERANNYLSSPKQAMGKNSNRPVYHGDNSEYPIIEVQSIPDNSNLLGKSKKVRVIGSLKQITGNKKMDGEGMQLSNKIYRDGH